MKQLTEMQRTRWVYISGFLLSLGLTLAAYALVVRHDLSEIPLLIAIIGLALVQFLVQLVFFLHIDRESRPHWNLVTLLFMILVVCILAFGSLWIMTSLNYHHDHMTPGETDQFIIQDEGIKP